MTGKPLRLPGETQGRTQHQCERSSHATTMGSVGMDVCGSRCLIAPCRDELPSPLPRVAHRGFPYNSFGWSRDFRRIAGRKGLAQLPVQFLVELSLFPLFRCLVLLRHHHLRVSRQPPVCCQISLGAGAHRTTNRRAEIRFMLTLDFAKWQKRRLADVGIRATCYPNFLAPCTCARRLCG